MTEVSNGGIRRNNPPLGYSRERIGTMTASQFHAAPLHCGNALEELRRLGTPVRSDERPSHPLSRRRARIMDDLDSDPRVTRLCVLRLPGPHHPEPALPAATVRRNVGVRVRQGEQREARAFEDGGYGGNVWTWVAIDADTKLIPCWTIGRRETYGGRMRMRSSEPRMLLTSSGTIRAGRAPGRLPG